MTYTELVEAANFRIRAERRRYLFTCRLIHKPRTANCEAKRQRRSRDRAIQRRAVRKLIARTSAQ